MAKKKTIDQDVYELALERVGWCYDNHDLVVVAFSGGKDSTAVLNVAIEVAEQKGRLPVTTYHFDEECIPPETVDYVDRVLVNPKVKLLRWCVPMKARNACSRSSPDWFPWAEEDRKVWVRELPVGAITENQINGFERTDGNIIAGRHFGPEHGSVCIMLGIRSQESITRYRMISKKAGRDKSCFWNSEPDFPHITRAFPIYDWMVEDVWLAPNVFGWDYNRGYDVMAAAGLSRNEARCSPPFGEQPIRGLWRFKECWPELWAKMVDRVPGAATAARYANTELYGRGELSKSDTVTWQEMVERGMDQLPEEAQVEVAEAIRTCFLQHYRYTTDAMPDEERHERSGYSWKVIYPVVAAGGDKFGRQSQKIGSKALNFRVERGIPP